MKRIIKNASPSSFETWKQGDGKGATYETHGSDVRRLCIQPLLNEQKSLCCYTGIGISESTAHIEHLYSQSQSRSDGTEQDMDYGNMLAAYPKGGYCPYGAIQKANQGIEVTPLDVDCESRFKFDLDGNVTCRRPADTAALNTIEVLKLNHDRLVARRKTAIDEMLFPDDKIRFDKELSAAKILRIKAQMQKVNKHENYPRFCFVIEQACDLALEIKKKREKKKENKARFSPKPQRQKRK